MMQLGLTGGIGSGKSAAALIFKSLGISVYHSDDRAKWLMENDQNLVSEIKSVFGTSIFLDKKLNRNALAEVVFNDHEMLDQLNNLVHPKVELDFTNWHKQQKDQPYVIQEAAITIEKGSWRYLDGVILVVAPEELRIQRVIERDGGTKESVQNRINNQASDSDKIPFSDFILVNDGLKSLVTQVLEIHKRILD